MQATYVTWRTYLQSESVKLDAYHNTPCDAVGKNPCIKA